jgi:uncharacterized SAM-binding protein YcdF (DUF218 family)
MLVRAEEPVPSDAILVLAGDAQGNRILEACKLLKQGFAPFALVSGPVELPVYGFNEADLAIRFAAERNCPAERLVPIEIKAFSTAEEARQVGEVLREKGVRSLLLVTSNFHTARAWREFHDVLGAEVRLRTVAAPDRFFRPENWWQSRQGQKTWFFEIAKTAADAIGL